MIKEKQNMMTAIVLILAAGFLVTCFMSYFSARSSLRNEITASSLPLTSDTIYSEIQRDLFQPVFISSLMAQDTFLRDWALQGEREEAAVVRYLKEIQDAYNTVTSFFVSDRTGTYYQSGGKLKQVSPQESRDEWYYRLKKMDADYEINIDLDLANNDQMTIFINYKVFDYAGNFIGATGVGLTVHAVKKLIEEYQLKYNRLIFFADKSGVVRLHGAQFPATHDSLYAIGGLQSVADSVLASPGGSYAYRREGSGYYLHTRFIKEFNWILLVEEPDTTSKGALLNTLLINIALSLIVTVLVFLILRIQIKKYQQRIENLAATDKLTGLYNRQAFDFLVDETLKDCRRTKKPAALIMLDLDLFKNINDVYGHLSGDGVLVASAGRIRSSVRENDLVCRWGGEEFLVLLKGCNYEGALRVAETIRAAFEAAPFMVQGVSLRLTASLGLTLLSCDENRDQAIGRADAALYKAKSAGRNRTEST